MSKHRLRIALLGSTGRMGQIVIQLIQGDFRSKVELVSCPSRDAFDKNRVANEILDSKAECVLDFALPGAMVSLIDDLKKLDAKKAISFPVFVVGSTGWQPADLKKLQWLSTKASIVQTSNFSIGVHLMKNILREYSGRFTEFSYDSAIVEHHHIHKKDVPSGTALQLADAIYEGAKKGAQKKVAISSVRVGEVIGTHEVGFYGHHDEFTFTHKANSRSLFGQGALEVALWLAQSRGHSGTSKRKPGFYSMDSFLEEAAK